MSAAGDAEVFEDRLSMYRTARAQVDREGDELIADLKDDLVAADIVIGRLEADLQQVTLERDALDRELFSRMRRLQDVETALAHAVSDRDTAKALHSEPL